MIKDVKRSLTKLRISNSKRNSSVEFEIPIASAAIIFCSNNIEAIPVLIKLKQELYLKESNLRMVIFKKKDEKELLEFTQKRIDLLITFADEDSLLLSLLTATCNAGLKVGNDSIYEKPLDVIIKSGDDVKLFASEVIKFLKQLKNKNDE